MTRRVAQTQVVVDIYRSVNRLNDENGRRLQIAIAGYQIWQAFRRRFILLHGPGFEIPESDHLEDGETYELYLSREPSVAGTMAFQAGGSLERQLPGNSKRHRSGFPQARLNVAALLANSFTQPE